MSSLNVALLGFGTVGKGVYETIESHQSRLKQLLGREVRVAAILVKNKEKHTSPNKEILLTTEMEDILSIPDLHVVVDAIVGCEPGFTYLSNAIKKGCHIITANKEMFAYHGSELLNLAKENGVFLGYEATVAGGIPVIQTIRQLLQVNRLVKIEAILNGTSNFILTSMRKDGLSFEETLQLAQANGYAEADPSNDIEGHDAFYKGVVLSQLIYGEKPLTASTTRKGITDITASFISSAERLGLRFRHIVTLFKAEGEIVLKVEPVLVSPEHPFYQVEGVQNGVSIETDLVGNVQLQGPGAGKLPTASAILEDFIQIERGVSASPCTKDYETESFPTQRWVLFSNTAITLSSSIHIINRLDEGTLVIESDNIEEIISNNPTLSYYPLKGDYQYTPEQVAI
jgi:homoserine dehydrogenase